MSRWTEYTKELYDGDDGRCLHWLWITINTLYRSYKALYAIGRKERH